MGHPSKHFPFEARASDYSRRWKRRSRFYYCRAKSQKSLRETTTMGGVSKRDRVLPPLVHKRLKMVRHSQKATINVFCLRNNFHYGGFSLRNPFMQFRFFSNYFNFWWIRRHRKKWAHSFISQGSRIFSLSPLLLLLVFGSAAVGRSNEQKILPRRTLFLSAGRAQKSGTTFAPSEKEESGS